MSAAATVERGGIAAAQLPLGAREVDVWQASLDDKPAPAVQAMEAILSDEEHERARRFFFARERVRFVVGRGILRVLLARYTGGSPQALTFTHGTNGKPALTAGEGGRAPLFFNVTHSDGLALYAFTRAGEVGIDVERIRELPDWEQVAASAFSPRELERLRATPPERRRDEFFNAWARQEAVLKALGTGLSSVEVFDSEHGFVVHPLKLKSGYAGALAVRPFARWHSAILGWAESESGNIPGGRLDGDSPGTSRLQSSFDISLS